MEATASARMVFAIVTRGILEPTAPTTRSRSTTTRVHVPPSPISHLHIFVCRSNQHSFSKSQQLVAFLLEFFIGSYTGAGSFYLGYTGQGVGKILLTWVSCVMICVAGIAGGIWCVFFLLLLIMCAYGPFNPKKKHALLSV